MLIPAATLAMLLSRREQRARQDAERNKVIAQPGLPPRRQRPLSAFARLRPLLAS
jgi:hypothetical protein